MADQRNEDTMAAPGDDVIVQLATIAPNSPAAAAWAGRPEVARSAQATYALLLEPADPAGVTLIERALIALRVSARTPSTAGIRWYRARLRHLGADTATIATIEAATDGVTLLARLAAIMRHTDTLATAPSNATPADLDALKAAGLSAADIVTIAQLIAFVSFQVRAVAALRALGEAA